MILARKAKKQSTRTVSFIRIPYIIKMGKQFEFMYFDIYNCDRNTIVSLLVIEWQIKDIEDTNYTKLDVCTYSCTQKFIKRTIQDELQRRFNLE